MLFDFNRIIEFFFAMWSLGIAQPFSMKIKIFLSSFDYEKQMQYTTTFCLFWGVCLLL